jgi:hypothetical protein
VDQITKFLATPRGRIMAGAWGVVLFGLVGLFLLNSSTGTGSGAIKPIHIHPRVTKKTPQPAVKPGTPLIASSIPPAIAARLIDHEVAVVEIYDPGAANDPVIADVEANKEAKAGAAAAGAGFAAVDVRDDSDMQIVSSLVTASSDPFLFIVDRSGKILFQRSGYLDAETVAQAAANALAGQSTDQVPIGPKDGITGPYDGYWKAKVDQLGCDSIAKADAIAAGSDREELDAVAKVWSDSLASLEGVRAVGPDAHYLTDIVSDVRQAIAQIQVMADALRHHKTKAFNAAGARFAAIHNHLFDAEAKAGIACFSALKK